MIIKDKLLYYMMKVYDRLIMKMPEEEPRPDDTIYLCSAGNGVYEIMSREVFRFPCSTWFGKIRFVDCRLANSGKFEGKVEELIEKLEEANDARYVPD